MCFADIDGIRVRTLIMCFADIDDIRLWVALDVLLSHQDPTSKPYIICPRAHILAPLHQNALRASATSVTGLLSIYSRLASNPTT